MMTRVIAFNGMLLVSGAMALLFSFIRMSDRARITVVRVRVAGITMVLVGAANLVAYVITGQEPWFTWLGIPLFLILAWLVERGHIR